MLRKAATRVILHARRTDTTRVLSISNTTVFEHVTSEQVSMVRLGSREYLIKYWLSCPPLDPSLTGRQERNSYTQNHHQSHCSDFMRWFCTDSIPQKRLQADRYLNECTDARQVGPSTTTRTIGRHHQRRHWTFALKTTTNTSSSTHLCTNGTLCSASTTLIFEFDARDSQLRQHQSTNSLNPA